MSRTQNVKRNLTFNILKYLTQTILKFVCRTVLIYTLGSQYIGLNGLFSNIFSFLNLAELGIGSAIVFAMYKPIANGDIEKIKSLQNLYKKFYLVIALMVLAIGGILTPFINIFINGDVPSNINVYILFIMYLFNAVVGYLSAHKRSLLLAYERNDIENKIATICVLSMSAIQVIVLLVFKNYYAYFAVNILFTIIECILVQVIANKYFPEINGTSAPIDIETKKLITKNIAALSLHKIGGAVVFSTDNILISSFFGLTVLGAYSNYALITSTLTTVFTLLTNAFTGSVGNLVANCDIEHSYKKYKQINFIFSFISAYCTICMFVLFQPFIKKWTGGGEYMLEFSTVLIICLSFYLLRMRSATILFKDCVGLFWQDRWKPIVESIINLGASIGLGLLIGINGIFIGTIISTLFAPFWIEPYMLHKHYFKKGVWSYFKRYIFDLIIMIVGCTICYYFCLMIPDGSIWLLIAKFVVCMAIAGVFLLICYCWTPEFKETLNLIKPFFKKFFNKKNEKVKDMEGKNNDQ